jgi:PAS domain S-box-containing protein
VKHTEGSHPIKRPSRRPFLEGFVSHLMGSFQRSIDKSQAATRRLCQATAVVGVIALTGWVTGFPFLTRGHPASDPLSPMAASCFLLLALGLFNYNRNPLDTRSKAFMVFAALSTTLLAAIATGPMGPHWAGIDPFSRASLVCLGLAMALSPLFTRRRLWGGDVLGALVLLLILINGAFLSGTLHRAPISLFGGDQGSLPFLACVSMILMGLAVLGRLGPRYFPLRLLSGSAVRAVILRHSLPVVAAALLIFDILNGASYGRMPAALPSFLLLLLSLTVVVTLSFRSADVIGRRIESSLKESEERYAVLIDSLKDYAVLMLDSNGRILTWNVGAERIHGYGVDEVLGDPVSRFYPPEERESGKMQEAFKEATLRGSHEDHGWRMKKDGSRFWAEVVTTPFIDDKNVLLGFSQVLRDITQRKIAQDNLTASLREKEAMLKEIHHRVKNNLQMISSLLRLQSENIHDPALLSIFLESQNRVRSISIIHECLYQSPDLARMDFSDYVAKLTDNLFRTYSAHPEKSTLRLDVDKVPLSLDVAIPCGLIITELVSNALKYAYPQGREGVVYVHFRVLPGNQYELTVADEGVGIKGPVNFESNESLGLRLVHILTEQLRGRIRVENGTGAKFIVTFKEPEGRATIEGGRP